MVQEVMQHPAAPLPEPSVCPLLNMHAYLFVALAGAEPRDVDQNAAAVLSVFSTTLSTTFMLEYSCRSRAAW
jgi:hypothetical protein